MALPIHCELQNALPADFVRELEFDKASLDVESRYKRCATHWEEHLKRTRAVILRAALLARVRRKAVLLGAGLLHDIPLAELSEMFGEVVLVDVVHSRSCQLRASMFTNVRCLQADVTGTASHLVQVRKNGGPLQRIEPVLFRDDPHVDLTVSVNLLSQLGCAPAAFLAASHGPDAISSFQRHLVESHLAYLRQLPGHSALVTDVAWSSRPLRQNDSQPVRRRAVLHQVPLPPPVETWDWLIAPAPEADPHHDLLAHVAAYPDWKEANRIFLG
jgi:hypothetical protein